MSENASTEPTTYPNLPLALAAFQAGLPSVRKGNTAKVDGAKGSYSYDYADLTDVSEAILPALAAVGLTWVTIPTTDADGTLTLTWHLVHGESGQEYTGVVPVGKKGDRWQDIGSALTYARRYMLVSVTGVAPGGDDNDGENANAGSTRQEPVKQYLPEGLYDLTSIQSQKDAETMFYAARGQGHLGLFIQTHEGTEVPFGEWLRATASGLPAVRPEDVPAEEAKAEETPDQLAERLEAEAIAAHEAEVAAQEAADAQARKAGS